MSVSSDRPTGLMTRSLPFPHADDVKGGEGGKSYRSCTLAGPNIQRERERVEKIERARERERKRKIHRVAPTLPTLCLAPNDVIVPESFLSRLRHYLLLSLFLVSHCWRMLAAQCSPALIRQSK